MVIERESNQIIIKLDSSLVNIQEIQRYADYFRFLESNAKNQGTEEQATELARQVHRSWWAENRSRFIK